MNKPIPKHEWIDRCATRMGEHDIGISPEEGVSHAAELWSEVAHELAPEIAADYAVGSIEAIEQLFCRVEA